MLLSLILITAIAYIAACLFLVVWQRRIIFFPSNVLKNTPQDLGLNHEEVWLTVNQMRCHGWWLPRSLENNHQEVLLYLHGNGENIAANLNQAKIFQELGFSVLLIDYRGYGLSEGEFPSENQVYEDAEAAWNYLTQHRNINPENIIIYGHSLGGAIAINLAINHPEAAGLIAESTFTSIKDMGNYKRIYKLFPLSLILHQKFDSINKIKSLKIPLLLIHGTADDVVPSAMSQALFEQASVPKEILFVPNADHNNVATISGETYRQTIRHFSQLMKSKSNYY